MLRPGNEYTGTVDEYLHEVGMDRVMGWVAVYAQEVGDLDVFWSYDAEPNDLPDDNLQAYLVFYKRHSKVYTIWIDGYDEYSLIGKDKIVKGKMLSDKRFVEVQKVAKIQWEMR
jgi:hypothetical protein